MSKICCVKWRGKEYSFDKGITYKEVAKTFQEHYEYDIVLALVNNKLRELHHTLKEDCEIEFETLTGHSGHKAYKRSCCLLLIK